MHQWYVIQVLSGKEKKVKKSIEEKKASQGMEDLIKEIIVPTERVSEVKMGKQKITEKRIWPGYLLVNMILTDEAFIFLKNTDGVIDFLGGNNPTPLKETEMKDILKYLEEKKEAVVHKHEVAVGDTVKIIDGVFINFIGNVIEVNYEKGRLSVLVSIFGRDTRVDDLEFWQVEEEVAKD